MLIITISSTRLALGNYELQLALMPTKNTPQHQQALTRISMGLCKAIAGIVDSIDCLEQLDVAHRLPSSVVGCIALPLALHILDIKLSSYDRTQLGVTSAGPRIFEKQSRLDSLLRAMRAYHSRFDSVEWVSTAIRYFMECTYFDQVPERGSSRREFELAMADCDKEPSGVLEEYPLFYLRLSLTLDLSLRKDRLPEENDFPVSLRDMIYKTGCFVPILFGQVDSESPNEDSISNIHDIMGGISPAPPLDNIDGWVANDRSLYFAQEIGLSPFELGAFGTTQWMTDGIGEGWQDGSANIITRIDRMMNK